MITWLDRVAADLLHLEADLRTALRAMSRGGPQHHRTLGAGRVDYRTITIGANEARTLLRGAMPVPIGSTRLREPHARMMAALSQFSAHMVALNDPIRPPDAALAAAAALVEELTRWQKLARWMQATRRAKVKWPAPRLPVTAIMQRQTAEQAFSLPNAAAGELHHPAAAMRFVQQLRAEQAELDLAPPTSAEVVDLRQLPLPLHKEAVDARTAA
jgi:hypothetical protein